MYTVAEVVLMTRSRAMVTHEPRQDRKVAAVSGSDHVMWGHLAGANPWSCRGSGVQRRVHGLFFLACVSSLVEPVNQTVGKR
jgi:hypothetical protein